MIRALFRLVKAVLLLPVRLWRELVEIVTHQTLVKHLEQTTDARREVQQRIQAAKVSLALATTDAEAKACSEQLGKLLVQDLALNRRRMSIRKQILKLETV